MLTKEQRAELAETLSVPWGSVHLICDGRRISLQVNRVSKTCLKYRVFTFVDGEFKGAWYKGETPEAKFLRKAVLKCCTAARRKEAEKALGKKWVANNPLYSGTITHYWPDWPNGKGALDHLCKVCDSVEIAPPDQIETALARVADVIIERIEAGLDQAKAT